jgi:hypothetical protein
VTLESYVFLWFRVLLCSISAAACSLVARNADRFLKLASTRGCTVSTTLACRARKLDGTANLPEDTYQNGKSNFSSEAKLQWAGSRENISPPAVGGVFS